MSHHGGRRLGATGEHTTRGVPRGVTSITPYVAVPDVAGAIEFYRDVFGARAIEITRRQDTVVHAQLDLGDGHLHLEAPDPQGGLTAPPADATASYCLGYYCEDLEAVLARAQKAGARVLTPPIDFVSGDRFVALTDPHGVQWSIISRVEDLSESDSAARIAAWADQS